MIALTYFPRLRESQGQRIRTTWEKLVERLSVARVVANKHQAPGVSLATYHGDRRAIANVEKVYAVGLDLDERVNWEELTRLFDDVDSFLHTTWSSSSDAPRARVFIRLSRPVTGDEYRRAYAAMVMRCESYNLTVDRAASDPSRLWFLPATPTTLDALNRELEQKGLPPSSSVPPFRYSIGRGKPLNVDWALATFQEPEPEPVREPAPSRPRVASTNGPSLEERVEKYLDRCEPAISGQGGHTTTFKLAMKLVQGFALDVETAFRLIQPWNDRCQPPWKPYELRRKLQQAYERGRMPEGALRDAQRRAS